MSGRETKGDATGWKRGEKGYASNEGKGIHRQWDGAEALSGSYDKKLLEVKAVGQIATTGDNADGKQRGY